MFCSHDPELRLVLGSHRLRDRTVVIPIGEIDLDTSGMLRSCLAGCAGRVIVDLSAVTFLDSSGIGALAAERNRLLGSEGSLELRGPHDIVRAAIEAVGLAAWITN
jgi:anti-anti-sigma factor